MKKILLASTILVGTAGFAAADNANFSWSGEAATGFAYNTNTAVGTPTISASFTAGMMTTTDGGLEAGATITVTAGGLGMETDNTDTAFGTVTTSGATVSDAEVYLSGSWGKVTVSYSATTEMDYAYTNTWGDFTLDVEYDWFAGASNDAALIGGTYAFGDYSVYATANFGQAGGWSFDSVDFGGSASMSGFSLGVDATYTVTGSSLTWKATAGYATGAYSISAFVEDDDNANSFDYGVDGSYDLGGGVAINAGVVYDNDFGGGAGAAVVTGGISMAF